MAHHSPVEGNATVERWIAAGSLRGRPKFSVILSAELARATAADLDEEFAVLCGAIQDQVRKARRWF